MRSTIGGPDRGGMSLVDILIVLPKSSLSPLSSAQSAGVPTAGGHHSARDARLWRRARMLAYDFEGRPLTMRRGFAVALRMRKASGLAGPCAGCGCEACCSGPFLPHSCALREMNPFGATGAPRPTRSRIGASSRHVDNVSGPSTGRKKMPQRKRGSVPTGVRTSVRSLSSRSLPAFIVVATARPCGIASVFAVATTTKD